MKITKIRKIQAYLNSFFWLFSTHLLAPYFYFLIFLRKRKKQKNQQFKILVISIGKIGDLVCMTPVFREIKKKFPSCYLTAITISVSKDVLKNNLRLDEIIIVDDYPGIRGKLKLINKLRKEKYDWAFSLSLAGAFINIIPFWSLVPNRATLTHKYAGETMKLVSVFSNYRSEYKRHTPILKHRLALLKSIGIENCSEEKEIFITPEEERKAEAFLSERNLNSKDLLIGICVNAGVKLKEWAPANFARLADQLIEKLKAKIIFIGSTADQVTIAEVQRMMQNNSVNAAGLFKLHELPVLLKKLKLSISADVGPVYIANTVGVPVVVIAGPANMAEQCPSGNRYKIIQKNLYCVPCSFIFTGPRFCKEGHLKCLKETTPEEVFGVARELIKSTSL